MMNFFWRKNKSRSSEVPRLCLPLDEKEDGQGTNGRTTADKDECGFLAPEQRPPPQRRRSSSFDASSQRPGIASLLLPNPLLLGLQVPSAASSRNSLLQETLGGAGSIQSTSDDSISDLESANFLFQQHLRKQQRRMSLDLPRACVHCSYLDALARSRECSPSPTFPTVRHLSISGPSTTFTFPTVTSSSSKASSVTLTADPITDDEVPEEEDSACDDNEDDESEEASASDAAGEKRNQGGGGDSSRGNRALETAAKRRDRSGAGSDVRGSSGCDEDEDNEDESRDSAGSGDDEMAASFRQRFVLRSPMLLAQRTKSLDYYSNRSPSSSSSTSRSPGATAISHGTDGNGNGGLQVCTVTANNNIDEEDDDCKSPDIITAARKGRSHSLDIAIGVPFQAQANLRYDCI